MSRQAARPSVTFFMPNFLGGGAERALVVAANGLVKKGYEATFLVIRDVGPNRTLIDPRISVRSLGTSRMRSAIGPLTAYLSGCSADYLISGLEHANIGVMMAATAARFRGRIVLTNHSQWAGASLRRPLSMLAGRVGAWAYRKADLVLTVSGTAKADLVTKLHLSPETVHVLYNAVEVVSPVERTLGRGAVIAVGRLVPSKRFDLLLRAFRTVRQETGALLRIFGDGPELANLRALASELGLGGVVEFAGYSNSLRAEFSRAALLVSSSEAETFGNVLVEAIAAGLPVVSADCGGVVADLGRGLVDRIVPAGDSQALAKAMIEVLSEAVPPEEISGRARRFHQDVIADELADFLALLR